MGRLRAKIDLLDLDDRVIRGLVRAKLRPGYLLAVSPPRRRDGAHGSVELLSKPYSDDGTVHSKIW